MATVEKKTKTVVDGVVLTLSVEEAHAVARALGSTAGSANEIERVWSALNDNGFSGEGFLATRNSGFRVDTVKHW